MRQEDNVGKHPLTRAEEKVVDAAYIAYAYYKSDGLSHNEILKNVRKFISQITRGLGVIKKK